MFILQKTGDLMTQTDGLLYPTNISTIGLLTFNENLKSWRFFHPSSACMSVITVKRGLHRSSRTKVTPNIKIGAMVKLESVILFSASKPATHQSSLNHLTQNSIINHLGLHFSTLDSVILPPINNLLNFLKLEPFRMIFWKNDVNSTCQQNNLISHLSSYTFKMSICRRNSVNRTGISNLVKIVKKVQRAHWKHYCDKKKYMLDRNTLIQERYFIRGKVGWVSKPS